jgi:hypothetical protein
VRNRDLTETKAAVLEFFEQFDAETSVGFVELHLLEYATAEQPKITVHITQFETEGLTYGPVVRSSQGDANVRVGPPEAVTRHIVHAVTVMYGIHQTNELPGVELCVSIGIKDEILGSRGKTRSESGAVAQVGRMVDDSELGEQLLELGEDFARMVTTAVVDDEDFVFARETGKRRPSRKHDTSNCSGVVICGKQSRDTRFDLFSF